MLFDRAIRAENGCSRLTNERGRLDGQERLSACADGIHSVSASWVIPSVCYNQGISGRCLSYLWAEGMCSAAFVSSFDLYHSGVSWDHKPAWRRLRRAISEMLVIPRVRFWWGHVSYASARGGLVWRPRRIVSFAVRFHFISDPDEAPFASMLSVGYTY